MGEWSAWVHGRKAGLWLVLCMRCQGKASGPVAYERDGLASAASSSLGLHLIWPIYYRTR